MKNRGVYGFPADERQIRRAESMCEVFGSSVILRCSGQFHMRRLRRIGQSAGDATLKH